MLRISNNIDLFLIRLSFKLNRMSHNKCLKCLKSLSNEPPVYGLHQKCFYKWFELKQSHSFQNIARKQARRESEGSGPQLNEGAQKDVSSFFIGKFRKYSAELGGSSYILKVREPAAPELPVVEYLSNQIADLLSIPVAKFYLIEFSGERAFVTQNFIDNRTTTNLVHIYHFYENAKASDRVSNCEALLKIIATRTTRQSDIRTFIEVCLFDSLIGNHDRHGRNLGFLVTPGGTSLAPIYDNPSALGLEAGEWLKADFSPKGRIATQATTEPTAKDYVIEFRRLGYFEQVWEFKNGLELNLKKIDALIEQSFCSELMKGAFKKLIHKREKEIQDACVD